MIILNVVCIYYSYIIAFNPIQLHLIILLSGMHWSEVVLYFIYMHSLSSLCRFLGPHLVLGCRSCVKHLLTVLPSIKRI